VTALAGHVVVVTGGARGMGRAYVEALRGAGARVAALDRAWSEIDAPQGVLALACDVMHVDQVEAARTEVLERFGTVDVLINNAAMRQRDLFPPHGSSTVLAASDRDWQAMLDMNVVGVVRVTRCFVEPMLRQRRGSIINISSRGSSLARNQPYAASKAALTDLSVSLAQELREYGIAVNVVIPGGTRTTGSDEMVAGRQALGQPMAALLRPEHVVPLVLYLAQQDASGDTGQAFDAVDWNARHGHGARDAWLA
jgi:NAD(P)-dependent dehydrogenase (short-subunit alcohol dehydrogenase family)